MGPMQNAPILNRVVPHRTGPVAGENDIACPAGRMTDTQLGKIGEAIVAVQLIFASNGRFSPYLPMADDNGLDLILHDKLTGICIPVQVKTRSSAKVRKDGTIDFDVRSNTFSDRKGTYLLAVLLDMPGNRIDWAWLIPMDELSSVARVGEEKLSISPSAKQTSNDRYARFRCRDMAEVVQRLSAYLEA